MDVNDTKIDSECICHGNWRAIVKESEPFIGMPYKTHDGKIFTFFGIVHGEDDYYYGMWDRNMGLRLLSCVVSIEGHGYTLLNDGIQEVRRKI